MAQVMPSTQDEHEGCSGSMGAHTELSLIEDPLGTKSRKALKESDAEKVRLRFLRVRWCRSGVIATSCCGQRLCHSFDRGKLTVQCQRLQVTHPRLQVPLHALCSQKTGMVRYRGRKTALWMCIEAASCG
jgi:hypothetical protein